MIDLLLFISTQQFSLCCFYNIFYTNINHYYTVERCEVRDYQDTTTYDFTRTDENLILYTCYPFDALGFTPNRYFVYASYTSGPELDADR